MARNLREFPFPGRAETSQKRAVLSKCMDALSDVKGLSDSFSVEVDDLSELDRQILVEKHLIQPRSCLKLRKGLVSFFPRIGIVAL